MRKEVRKAAGSVLSLSVVRCKLKKKKKNHTRKKSLCLEILLSSPRVSCTACSVLQKAFSMLNSVLNFPLMLNEPYSDSNKNYRKVFIN